MTFVKSEEYIRLQGSIDEIAYKIDHLMGWLREAVQGSDDQEVEEKNCLSSLPEV